MLEDFTVMHKNNIEINVNYYSFSDNADYIDEAGLPRIHSIDDRIMAKKVFADKTKQYNYYIRRGYDNKIYNPLSQIVSKNKLQVLQNDSVRFKLVNKQAFDLFMQYLITKDSKLFNQAERET